MKRSVLRKGVAVAFWLLLWQLIALWVDNPVLLATPFKTAQTLAELFVTKMFWKTVAGSLSRIALGFLAGVGAAWVLAVLSARFGLAQEILAPGITLLKAVPVASFVVLLLIWWGSSFLAVAICFLIVLPNIYISTLEGIKSADKKLLEMAEVFRVPLWNRFFYIYRPALKPFWESSLKLALGMCWKSGVAAEVIGTPAFSIGERLYLSKIYLDTAGVFAWTAVVILLSVCFERLILTLIGGFFAWKPSCRAVSGKDKRADGAALSCGELSKSYGELAVIQNRSAVYRSGETYYLTDPSGSGKTTFLRLLSGLETPDGGSVSPGLRFSFVFQEDRLCEDYSALQNVEMVLGKAGRERAKEALRGLLPGEAMDKPCGQLSGGMKRRVALVRAMEADSDCVLLDEPFTGMDEKTRGEAEAYIRARQQGRILIIASHL